jgi:metallophosphoesterase (TIGR00282 family)
VRILFVADVVGVPGRRAIEDRLGPVRDELQIDFCIVNGENIADGVGITPKLADKLLASGADVVTLGNHTWRRAEIVPYLEQSASVARPANFSARAPGRGLVFGTSRDGAEVAVVNVQGALFMDTQIHPFEVAEALVDEALQRTRVVVVDIHAEATSEKVALSRMLDGKATAVIGTHTHVQTNDARVQPGGTAALTDAGMTGPHNSVIGVVPELAIRRMRTGMPVRFETGSGDVRIEGALVECGPDGRATRCETVRVQVDA